MLLTGVNLDGVHSSPTRHDLGRVTAIIGPSGSGKTRLVHLVHRAREIATPYGTVRPNLVAFARPGAAGVRVILEVAFDEQERARFGAQAVEEVEATHPREGTPKGDVSAGARAALGHYGQEGAQGFWELVPAERLAAPAFVELAPTEQRRLRASEGADKYAWLETFYADVALGAMLVGRPAPGIAVVNEAFEEVGCPIRLDHARRRGATFAPYFDVSGDVACGLSSLPAGHRQVALFVALVLLFNPRRAVILVDDLDRDLDHRLREGVLRLLVGGSNQVVFTTRSEKLASSSLVTSVVALSSPPLTERFRHA